MRPLLARAFARMGTGLGSKLRHAVVTQTAQRLAPLLDSHTMISEIDCQQRFTYANRIFCELSGYSLDELLEREESLIRSDRHTPDFWREMQRLHLAPQAGERRVSPQAHPRPRARPAFS